MNRSFISRRCLLALAGCLGAGAASAAGVSPEQASQARALIQAQLDAFAADDAARAFVLSTEALRKRLGSPDRFMSMIRRRYPVVYRPATVAFMQPRWDAGRLIQGVQMTDAQGTGWLATYRLERQGQGPWLIAACEVVPSEGNFT